MVQCVYPAILLRNNSSEDLGKQSFIFELFNYGIEDCEVCVGNEHTVNSKRNDECSLFQDQLHLLHGTIKSKNLEIYGKLYLKQEVTLEGGVLTFKKGIVGDEMTTIGQCQADRLLEG